MNRNHNNPMNRNHNNPMNRNHNNPMNRNHNNPMNKNNNNPMNKNHNNKLNTSWKLYIHNLTEKDWSLSSYKEVMKFNTIDDCWTFFNNFKDFKKFNFYIMRNNIKPVYEDPENKNGYSYSYIIPGRKLNDTFIDIVVKMFSENLLHNENTYELCGLSLTPKNNDICILKIWLKNKNNVLKLNTNNNNLINGRFQIHKFY